MAVEHTFVMRDGADFFRKVTLEVGEDLVDITNYTSEVVLLYHDGRAQKTADTFVVGDGITMDEVRSSISLTIPVSKHSAITSLFCRGDYYWDVISPSGSRIRLMHGPFLIEKP